MEGKSKGNEITDSVRCQNSGDEDCTNIGLLSSGRGSKRLEGASNQQMNSEKEAPSKVSQQLQPLREEPERGFIEDTSFEGSKSQTSRIRSASQQDPVFLCKENTWCHDIADMVSMNNPSQKDCIGSEKKDMLLKEHCPAKLCEKTMVPEQSNHDIEIQQLRDENVALREEIMRVEAEKLKIEKDYFENEISYEMQIGKQYNAEKEEARKMIEELTSEITNLKQTSMFTNEKIESITKIHKLEVDMLKDMHARELQTRDMQLLPESTFLAENNSAKEALSQLYVKVDECSVKIEQLHKSLISERDLQSTDRTTWLPNLESCIVEQERFLQEWGKRTTGICGQLEKVVTTLDKTISVMEKLQAQEKVCLDSTYSHLQSLQELIQMECLQSLGEATNSKDKAVQIHNLCAEQNQTPSKFFEERKGQEEEKEAVLCMKEHICQVDSALKRHLVEHALLMEREAEEMARQQFELERAKDIAAEIAIEVENGRRELELHRCPFNRNFCQLEAIDFKEELSDRQGTNSKERLRVLTRNKTLHAREKQKEMHTQPRRMDQVQSASSSLNLTIQSAAQTKFLRGSTQTQELITEEEKDLYYLEAQEEFLIQAAKALEDMDYISPKKNYSAKLLGL